DTKARLKQVLTGKLTKKYGGPPGSQVNERIAAAVQAFTEAHNRVQQADLIRLEKDVKRLAKPKTARSSTAWGSTARGSTARGSTGRRSSGRGVGSVASASLSHVPTNLKNEWLIMETYKVLETEKAMREEKELANKKVRDFRAELDRHVEMQRKQKLKERQEQLNYDEQQQALAKEHRDHLEIERQELLAKAHREKEVRLFQMECNE
ncbi:unnamed protein product, partial [Chrysoparadoxa australica]